MKTKPGKRSHGQRVRPCRYLRYYLINLLNARAIDVAQVKKANKVASGPQIHRKGIGNG